MSPHHPQFCDASRHVLGIGIRDRRVKVARKRGVGGWVTPGEGGEASACISEAPTGPAAPQGGLARWSSGSTGAGPAGRDAVRMLQSKG